MPTYEYQCQACGHKMEQFQSITADPLKKCPSCKKLKLKRLISAGAGIIFKGSGFYETDYRSPSYKKGEKAEKEASSKDSAESSSESKSASGTKSNDKSSSAGSETKPDAGSKKSSDKPQKDSAASSNGQASG